MAGTALALAGSGVVGRGAAASGNTARREEWPLMVSTWRFGQAANERARQALAQGGSLLDAVEQGIRLVEADRTNRSVGLNGTPNAAGVVQLDACIMFGPGHRAGSVAALEGICHPITAARRVMEKTAHVMLAGEGARLFALQEGLESVKVDARQRYRAWQKKRLAERAHPPGGEHPPKGHDTISLLVLGADGTLAGGCSTSGLGGKLPGRVGDSPIIGSGLYVDNEVGAAGATGLGENIMRYCGSFLVVEFMRQGLSPQEACVATIQRIARQDPRGVDLSINFVALDKQGRYGAAGTGQGFPYAVATRNSSSCLASPGVDQVIPDPRPARR